MQSIEEIRNLGFHCNNFIEVSHPASIVNLYTKKQVINVKCECCGNQISNKGDVYVICRRTRITQDLIERINNAKLVAWWNQLPIRDFGGYISFKILDNEF